jgi:hypothetical protein
VTVEARGAVHEFVVKEHSNREIIVQLRNEFAAVLNSTGKTGGLSYNIYFKRVYNVFC